MNYCSANNWTSFLVLDEDCAFLLLERFPLVSPKYLSFYSVFVFSSIFISYYVSLAV